MNVTRHENFHGKFKFCTEHLIRLIGQKLTFMLKVFTDYLVFKENNQT